MAGKVALQAIAEEWLPEIDLGGAAEALPTVVKSLGEPQPLPGVAVAERVAEEVQRLLQVPFEWR